MHGLGVALAGGGEVEAAGRLDVLFHAVALFVEAGEPELGGREAGVGGSLEPASRFRQVLRHAAALGIAGAQFVFGGRVVGGGSGAQRRADRSRQRHRCSIDRPVRSCGAAVAGFRGIEPVTSGSLIAVAGSKNEDPPLIELVDGRLGGSRRRQCAFRRGHRPARRGRGARSCGSVVADSGTDPWAASCPTRPAAVREQELHRGLRHADDDDGDAGGDQQRLQRLSRFSGGATAGGSSAVFEMRRLGHHGIAGWASAAVRRLGAGGLGVELRLCCVGCVGGLLERPFEPGCAACGQATSALSPACRDRPPSRRCARRRSRPTCRRFPWPRAGRGQAPPRRRRCGPRPIQA